MSSYRYAVLALILGLCAAAGAQPAEPENGAAAAPEAPPAPPAAPKAGDMVVLMNGKSIGGVRVVRESPVFVEILSAPGAEPFRIPRRQVREVVRGDSDPFAAYAPGAGEGAVSAPDLMQGLELKPEFHQKISEPLSASEPIAYGETELIAVIRDLRQRTGLTIRLSDGIRAMPEAERAWTVEVPAGKPLLALLQQDLLQAFPGLVVDLEYEAVSIRTAAEPKAEPAN